jgi:hypothetical protein
MANSVEKSCTMLVYNDKQSSINDIKEALEGSDVEAKVEAMQKAVTLLLNGEQLPQLFITIVRYVLPSEDHAVQKLLLLYLVRAGRLACAGAGRAGRNPHLFVLLSLTPLIWPANSQQQPAAGISAFTSIDASSCSCMQQLAAAWRSSGRLGVAALLSASPVDCVCCAGML